MFLKYIIHLLWHTLMYYECNFKCNGMFTLILFVSQKRFISLFQNTFFIPHICLPPPCLPLEISPPFISPPKNPYEVIWAQGFNMWFYGISFTKQISTLLQVKIQKYQCCYNGRDIFFKYYNIRNSYAMKHRPLWLRQLSCWSIILFYWATVKYGKKTS